MKGTTLGPYRIEAELGAGGMGKVYRATTLRKAAGLDAGVTVALKVVHAHLLETEGFFKRFLREAEIGKAVVHENVVRTFDCDSLTVGGGRVDFLVMEFVEGQTLRALLAELDRVPEELCRHIGREVSKGLAAIHAAGVVHRDVKPENVIISRCAAPGHDHVAERDGAQPRRSEGHVHHPCEHVVKVMDLGVARLNDEALRLSQTGAFVGSIHYAAPECFGLRPAAGGEETVRRSSEGAKEDRVDHRADLHALGLVLYELSCGVNPYYADSVPEILKKVLHEEPRRLGDINPQLSPFFEEVVHCLLAKKPAGRFADATTLLGVLEDGERSTWWKARAKAIRATTKRPMRRIRIPRETAVYGREREIAVLRSLYERASAGEGQVVLVEGEAGIGKSRVVDELIAGLQRDGADVNFLFGSYPPGGAATAAGAFSTAFREQFGDAGSAAWLTQTPILAPAFDALLCGETTPAGVEALTKDSVHTCFVHATRNLAAERTTIVLVDDLHFAPDEGRALFAALSMAVPGHRALLVGTTRPGVDEQWLAQLTRLPHVAHTVLARLGPKDLVRLLTDTLRSDQVAAELSAQIALKSDGNPFFVFEILRGLREGQFLTQRDDGTWVTTRVIAEIRIPSSVLDLVNARVAELSEDERGLLDVACCAGFEFDPALIGEVLGVGRIPALKRFGQIERAHRLVRASGRNCVFDHHQVQEALYGSLHEQLREEYHAGLASALEARNDSAGRSPESLDGALCVDLCEHFLKSARPGGALRYLAPALVCLEKGCLNAQAAALAERALAVPDLLAGAERARTLLGLCAVNGPLDRLGRRARQEVVAREAERLAESTADAGLRGQAAMAVGAVCWRTSRLAEAEACYRRSQQFARSVRDRRAEASAATGLGNVVLAANRHAEAQEHYERALAICRETGDREGEGTATGNLGNVHFSQGRLAEARAHHERSLQISHEIGSRYRESIATANLAGVLALEGRMADAQAQYEHTLSIDREIGNRQGEAVATGNLGGTLAAQGRLVEAREHFERALCIQREIGNRRGEAAATANLGGIFHAQGRPAAAREIHERALAMSREVGNRQGEAVALYDLGRVLSENGEPGAAEERLAAGLAISEDIGDRLGVAQIELALGALHAEAGRVSLARERLTRSLAESSKLGYAGDETLARCHLAALPGGDVADAEKSFETNDALLTVWERTSARWLLWKASGERAHLAEAKRLADESVSSQPPEIRASMLANVPLYRDIAAAADARPR